MDKPAASIFSHTKYPILEKGVSTLGVPHVNGKTPILDKYYFKNGSFSLNV